MDWELTTFNYIVTQNIKKQLRFELDDGATVYRYLRAISCIGFDCLYCDVYEGEECCRYENLIPDAEAEYYKFIQDKKAKVLTLRERVK